VASVRGTTTTQASVVRKQLGDVLDRVHAVAALRPTSVVVTSNGGMRATVCSARFARTDDQHAACPRVPRFVW
jgi:hypothetical protein